MSTKKYFPVFAIFPTLLLTLIILTFSCTPAEESRVALYYDRENTQAEFAVAEITLSLEKSKISTVSKDLSEIGEKPQGTRIILGNMSNVDIREGLRTAGLTPSMELAEEGFSIQSSGRESKKTIWIAGGEKAGTMYGGLEIAEQIRLYGLEGIKDMESNPYMKMRGIKFNIPLDVRTPTYTDYCDATRENVLQMWNFDFWKEHIDNLARYRYNFISLWSLHPFPSMVKVPEYPKVALDDVQGFTFELKDMHAYDKLERSAPEIQESRLTLKKMSIEEKIAFWQKVMAYGKSRNVDFYILTWNIFVSGTDGQYGLSEDIHNETTKDYFQKSIRQMYLTYPDLAGIGLTAGENMKGASTQEKEDWAFDAYAPGLMEVATSQPERNYKFIHRQHQTGAIEIAEKFKPVSDLENVDFLFSYKYAKAHVFSSTNQPFSEEYVKDIKGYKTLWTLRNDDNYYFRWGAPGFVREFIQNIPYEVTEGFYYGSDQWVWGREFISKDPETPRQIEIVKHWYHWMMWGRLGYDPEVKDERFIALLEDRFPEIKGQDLFNAWQEASLIYPLTTGFHWGALDIHWYIEACKSRPVHANTETGFHDVNRFISLPPHPGVNYQSIPNYTEMIIAGGSSNLLTPLEVSQKLHDHSEKALKILENLDGGVNRELNKTLRDIKTMAYLGKYYAFKISGSTYVDLARKIEEEKSTYQQNAVDELTKAAEYWKLYTELAQKSYKNPLWMNRVGLVYWDGIYESVLHDIEIAKEL